MPSTVSTGGIVGIVIGGVSVLALTVLLVIYLRRRTSRRHGQRCPAQVDSFGSGWTSQDDGDGSEDLERAAGERVEGRTRIPEVSPFSHPVPPERAQRATRLQVVTPERHHDRQTLPPQRNQSTGTLISPTDSENRVFW